MISSVAFSDDSVPGNRISSSERNWSTSSSGTGIWRDEDGRFKERDRELEWAEKKLVIARGLEVDVGE